MLVNIFYRYEVHHNVHRYLARLAYSVAFVTCVCSALTYLQTARLTVPPIPSTTPYPCEVAKKFQLSFKSLFSCQECRFENKKGCLNWDVGPSLKTFSTSISGLFERVYTSWKHTQHTSCGPDRQVWHDALFGSVAWRWHWCADFISFWLAMVACSEKSTCRRTCLLSTNDSKHFDCLRLTRMALVVASAHHRHPAMCLSWQTYVMVVHNEYTSVTLITTEQLGVVSKLLFVPNTCLSRN